MNQVLQISKKRKVSPLYLSEGEQISLTNLTNAVFFPRKKRIAFGWYGGKFSHLDWLLPLLPKCHHYCEPFAGSGAVLINKEPSSVETYNDIDGEVVNFFKTLRDKNEELIKAISLTPFSREEYNLAINGDIKGFDCDPPYLHETRGDSKAYGFEMSDVQHLEFSKAVNECKGMVAVSGYDHPTMDKLFKPGKWKKTFGLKKTIHSTKDTRTEVLWTNYTPPKTGQFK